MNSLKEMNKKGERRMSKIIVPRSNREVENIKELFGKYKNKVPSLMEIKIAALKDKWPEKIVKKMKKPVLPKIKWDSKARTWIVVPEEEVVPEVQEEDATVPEEDVTVPEEDATVREEDSEEEDSEEEDETEEGFDIDEFEDEEEEEYVDDENDE